MCFLRASVCMMCVIAASAYQPSVELRVYKVAPGDVNELDSKFPLIKYIQHRSSRGPEWEADSDLIDVNYTGNFPISVASFITKSLSLMIRRTFITF